MYDSSHLMVRNALRIGGSTSVSSFGLRLGYRFQQRAVLSIIQDSHEVNRARRDSCLIHRRGPVVASDMDGETTLTASQRAQQDSRLAKSLRPPSRLPAKAVSQNRGYRLHEKRR